MMKVGFENRRIWRIDVTYGKGYGSDVRCSARLCVPKNYVEVIESRRRDLLMRGAGGVGILGAK